MSLFDDLKDWFKKGSTSVSNYLNARNTTDTTTNANTTTTSSNTEDWQNFLNNVNLSTANSKAELSAVNNRTNSYVDNYLKSLGLSGTSAGTSQMALNGATLQNAYTNLNQNANDYIDTQRDKNTEYLDAEYQAAVNNGATSDELQAILNKYDDDSITSGYKNYLNSQAVEEIDWENDKATTISALNSQLENSDLTDYQKAQIRTLLGKLEDTTSSDSFNTLVSEYEDVIKDASSTGTTVSDAEALAKVDSGDYTKVYDLNDLPNDTFVFDGGNIKTNGEDFKSFNIKNGYQYWIVVNGEQAHVVYKNGKLYQID